MNNTKKTRKMAVSAIIAALYVALTYAQTAIFPGSTSMAVQFRVSEAFTVLALFSPSAIPGLTVGCFIANLISVGTLPLDMVLGTLATLLSVLSMHKLKDLLIKGVPVPALFMPALFNGLIIGLEIEIFFIEGGFHFTSFLVQGGLVALGELGVLFTLGLMLYKVIKYKNLQKYLF